MADQSCACQVCRGDASTWDSYLSTNVRSTGWTSLLIAGHSEFAYTVGLWHTMRQPEVVMFGLGRGMQTWLNVCVERCRDGWPADGVEFTGVVDGVPTQLRTVDRSWQDALFGTAHRFYGRFPPVRQLVWPDGGGRWPWDEAATLNCRRQARAWLPVAEQPRGRWRLLGELTPGFPVEPDALVLTTRSVLAGERSPTWVLRSADCFDILDDRRYDADDLCLAYLGEPFVTHPGTLACTNLPDNWQARRVDGAWVRTAAPAEVVARSEDVWERASQPAY